MSDPTLPRKKVPTWLKISTGVLTLIVIGLALIPEENKVKSNVSNNTPQTQVIYDIEALVGKSIQAIENEIGMGKVLHRSDAKQRAILGDIPSTTVYKKNGYEMGIRYSEKTNRVLDITFGPADSLTSNLDDLLQRGNLKKESADYYIKPLIGSSEGEKLYSAIKIVATGGEQLTEDFWNNQALTEIRMEPKVKEAVITDAKFLYVAVVDDGTPRKGYASYLCNLLKENNSSVRWVKVVAWGTINHPQADNAYGILLGECNCSSQ